MNAIIQQVLVVEYIVQNQMCEDCHRREAQDFWRSVVQVRQKARLATLLVMQESGNIKIAGITQENYYLFGANNT